MNTIGNLLVALVVLFVVIATVQVLMAVVGKRGRSKGLAYVSRGPLLTPAEAAFYPVLLEASRAGPVPCIVVFKVRLFDLIEPRRGLDASARQTLQNRIDRKHVDFVVVRASDFGVVAAVELDDSSHRRRDRRERDRFVDEAMRAAGVCLIHVPWRRGYVLEEVAGMLWGSASAAPSQS